jgi:hypothetical protein
MTTNIRTVTHNGAELQAARQAATERFLLIAAALKAEAGITEHVIRKSLSGYAWPSGKISAPEGRTRKQLYILAHECGHIALKHFSRKQPRHVEEMQAEKWAHDALRRHGVSVPRSMTTRAKQYVARKIRQAIRRGAKRIDPEAARYAASLKAQ